MNDPDRFRSEVKRRFTKLFVASKEGYKLPDIERHRLAGFIQAGVFLELVTNAEMQSLMNSVHVAVFGLTIKERQESRSTLWSDDSADYSQYEQPAYERLQK